MAIVRCPRCRDEVSVPAMATSRALVRCPLCLEEYLLSEALANSPPPLLIIGGEVPQAAIEDSPVVGHDYQMAAAAVHSPDNHWGHAVAATMPARPPNIRGGRRGRSREPNMALMILNWVGGGVLGLALAPLVLWWVFKTDPVDLGPTVAAYLPWAVPALFHGKPPVSDLEAEPIVRSPVRKSRKAKAEKESEPEPAKANEELQTVPGLNVPEQPSEPAIPLIEPPHTTKKPAAAGPTVAKEEEPAVPASPPSPMPDLTDLLP